MIRSRDAVQRELTEARAAFLRVRVARSEIESARLLLQRIMLLQDELESVESAQADR